VREIREREAPFRAQVREHIDRYTQWHAMQLRQVYRSSVSLQLVHLMLNRHIMERKAALLTARAEELQRWILLIRSSPDKTPPAEVRALVVFFLMLTHSLTTVAGS
jgi:hypothetical protein